jgi:hypothetical protein
MLNWFWWNASLWYQQLSCVYYKLCYLSSSQCRPWKCCNGLKMTQVTESGAAIAARLPCAAPAISWRESTIGLEVPRLWKSLLGICG